ncbi:hypothetical protein EBU99_08495 [bacterium]|nr:hypothetical protein [bacterium]
MFARIFTMALGLTFFVACQPRADVVAQDSTVESMNTTNIRLPIRGTWKATALKGFRHNQGNSLVPVSAQADKLSTGLWRVRLDLDSDGQGVIYGLSKCTSLSGTNSLPFNIMETSQLNGLYGILGLIRLLNRTADDVRCANSKDGNVESFVLSSPSRNFLGGEMNELAKNLGFVGEASDLKAADRVCRNLRGVRYVNIKDASSCVGFLNSAATQIRFVIIPIGEIHAVQIDMQRD